MNNIKKLLVSVALLGTTSFAAAADQNLGAIAVGTMKSFSSATPAGASFLDTIYFSLTSQGTTSAGVGTLNYTVAGTSILGIDNLSLALYDSANVQRGNGLDFTINSLSAGDYYLKVQGLTTGLQGGYYAGSIKVSPVPEPGTMGMMATGLMLMAMVMYRRRDAS